MGWSGECFIVCMGQSMTPAETDQYYRELDLSLKARGNDRFGFALASAEGQDRDGMQDAIRRQAEFLKSRAEMLRKTTAGFAMITQSFVNRVATRTIFTFAPPPFPYSIVANAHDAFAYLAKQNISLNQPAAIRTLQTEAQAIGLAVP